MKALIKILILLLFIILIISCGNEKKPRTIYWSGSTFHFPRDTSISWGIYYLNYYIELSDTGANKLMIRADSNNKMEFYTIHIPDTLKNLIYSLANNDSTYFLKILSEEDGIIYDGLQYNLRFISDSIQRTVTLIPPLANQIQKKVYNIMNEIREHPSIKHQTYFDLQEYQKITEKAVREQYPLKPLVKFHIPDSLLENY